MSIKPIEVLNNYLSAIARLDADACLALFAEDAVVRMPLMPVGAPTEIRGRANFSPAFHGLFGALKTMNWVSPVTNTTDDSELVVARMSSNAVLHSGGKYANDYALFVRVRDGKIVETTEYFDAAKAAAIFAPAAA
jgi:ketosteroid isomerase-like protein